MGVIRLRQSFGAHTGRVLELDGDCIRLGRLPDNDVVFDPQADLDASGRHAKILREGQSYVVFDVGSRNGTFVDGKRVERAVLRGGEEIEFGAGGPRLHVELPGGAPSLRSDRLLRFSIGVFVLGVLIVVIAVAVLLRPDD